MRLHQGSRWTIVDFVQSFRPFFERKRRPARRRWSFQPQVEHLEKRELMAYDTAISTAVTANMTRSESGSTVTFTSNATGANVQVSQIKTELTNFTTVIINNGSSGSENGNISWSATSNLDFNTIGASKTLRFEAHSGSTVGSFTLSSNISDSVAGLDSLAVQASVKGAITINNSISTGGANVTLTSTNGAVTQGASGAITAPHLSVTSVGGATITATNNAVNSFAATNTSSGDISLTNTAEPLTLVLISQQSGGNVTVNNTGNINSATAIHTGGTVSTSGNGNIVLNAISAGRVDIYAPLIAGGSGNITLTTQNGYGILICADLISTSGNISVTAGFRIELHFEANISTTGTVTLSVGDGYIDDVGTGKITAGTLSLTTGTGVTLNNNHQITSFSASNATSGAITLTNTASTLTLAGITQSAGNSVTVNNTGAITTTGTISTASNGAITLNASGTATIGAAVTAGGSGAVSVTASEADRDVILNATARSTSGNVSLSAGRHVILNAGAVTTSGNVILAGSAGTISESGAGTISAATLTTTAMNGITLGNNNVVSTFSATNTSSGNVSLTNTAALKIAGISQSGGTTSLTNTGAVNMTGTVTGSSATFSSTGAITLSGSLTATGATGTVKLSPSSGGVSQSAGLLTANKLLLTATGTGNFSLPATSVATVAAAVLGAVTLGDNRALTVGTVDSTNGITTGNASTTGGNVLISGASTIVINQPINTTIGSGGTQTLGAGVTNNSTITLGAGNVTITGVSGLSVLDVNKQVVLTPGVPQNDFYNWSVSLLAQVSGSTVSTYSWDTSQASLATSVSGNTTKNLTLTWGDPSASSQTQTISLTITNSDSTQQTQTYTFNVWKSTSAGYAASPPAMPSTWDVAIVPDKMTNEQAVIAGYAYNLGVATGEVMTTHTLPAYNPGVAPISLTYSSVAAEAKPIFLVYYQIGATLPPTVKAKLTLNGVAGTTYWYDTSASNGNPTLNPGDIMQIALQGDPTGLSTGRYSYSIDVTANYGTPVTTTLSGSVNIINDASSPYGAGWTIDNVQRIHAVSGGVILQVPGAKSLWFSDNGSGGYNTPAGDFSTLTTSAGNYTRTLKDGTTINFNSSGLQTSIVDRNGNTTTFSYSGTTLTAITDMNGLTTTLGYLSGKLTSITDPASRATTFAQDGSSRLTSITTPASAVWAYAYDSTSKRLQTITDPRTHTATFSFNGAGRVTGVSRADGTSDSLTPAQVNGLVLSGGTSGNPAAPMLLVNASAKYTDPRSQVWQSYTDWAGFGKATQTKDPLGNTAVTYRDSQGRRWLIADPLGHRERRFFETNKDNVTKLVHEDDSYIQYAYNSNSQPTTITDETGAVTTFAYNASGNLTQVTQPDPDDGGPLTSPVWTYTYTTKGSVSTQTNPLTRTTTYAYDTRNRVTAKTDPMTFTTTYAYDSASNLTSVTDPLTHTTTYGYDNVGRRTRMTTPLTHTTTYAYDATGNLTSEIDPLTHTTTYGYDNLNRPTRVTDPLTHTTTYAYDAAGNLTAVTDALTKTTSYAYDSASRLTAMTDANTHTTTYALDAKGQVLSVTDPLTHTTTYSYNSRGFRSTVSDATGHTTTQTFDATGALASEVDGFMTPVTMTYAYDRLHRLTAYTDELGNTTTCGYDAAGNPTKVTDPLTHTTIYAYDANDRLTAVTDALTHTTTYAYDATGNLTSETDPLTHTTTYAYDNANRLTAHTDALTHTTTYGYDAAVRLTRLTDPVGNVWTFSYDNANRPTAITAPTAHTITYSYDNANRLTSQTDRNGRQTNFGYDNIGQNTGETWISGGSPIYTATYAYDAADRLTSESDNYSTYTFAYDNANRLTSVSNAGTPGAPTVVLSYAYDQYGRRTSLSDNRSNGVLYSYDAAGRVTEFRHMATNWVLRPAYDAAGRVTLVSRQPGSGPSTDNDARFMSSITAYDAANRVTGITHTNTTAGTGSTFTYAYDNANRITGYTGPEGSVTYTYDNTNQLTGVSGARTETYTYDANGNRAMSGYSTTTGNRLTSDGTYNYTYDNEGNLTTKTKISDGAQTIYSYDYRNRLTDVVVKNGAGVTVTHDVFTYDVEGRRIAKAVDGTTTWTAYDGLNPWADFNNAGTQIEHYLYGLEIDQLFAHYDGTNWEWYLTDNIGSVRQIMSTTGVVLDQIAYDSFGNIVSETNPGNGDRFKFTGREWDSEIGQYFYRGRSYAPTIGRFLNEDPIGFTAADANLYRYVNNAPVSSTDPLGLWDWKNAVRGLMIGVGTGVILGGPGGIIVGGIGGFFGGGILGGKGAVAGGLGGAVVGKALHVGIISVKILPVIAALQQRIAEAERRLANAREALRFWQATAARATGELLDTAEQRIAQLLFQIRADLQLIATLTAELNRIIAQWWEHVWFW